MLYKEAANILKLASEEGGMVKNLIFSSEYENKKSLMALVCESVKYKDVLDNLVKRTKLTEKSHSLTDPWLASVLVYDLLIGRGIHGAAKLKNAVEKHKAHLQSELTRIKVQAGVKDVGELLTEKSKVKDTLPRYVRVNTLKTTVSDVIAHFRQDDYKLLPTVRSGYEKFLNVTQSMKEKQFTQDIHLPELLVFPPGTDLHDHPLYVTGDIILQDKASCLPAFALAPPPGSVVIDCCAAPGNKTTHAAAIMGNKGKIFAVDKDAHRLTTMNTLTLKAGVVCVQLIHSDFLRINPDDPAYAEVEYAIVDPSCSGSGIVGRIDVEDKQRKKVSESSRLNKLSNFQAHILKHALSFPAMKRVVYSTCSVNQEENERVVSRVKQEFAKYVRLVPILSDIPSRAIPDFEGSDACVRLTPAEDFTNGFFVACFERKEGVPIEHEVRRSIKKSFVNPNHKQSDNDKPALEGIKKMKPEASTKRKAPAQTSETKKAKIDVPHKKSKNKKNSRGHRKFIPVTCQ